MKRAALETTVGFFVLIGIVCLAWMSIQLGKWQLPSKRGYAIEAEFGSVEGLSKGTPIEIAGVEVGRVDRIRLRNYRAVVTMRIDRGIVLQDDAIASIRTKGLVGEKYISVSPGASDKLIPPGGRLRDTEDAINVEQLISQFIHGRIK